MGLIFIIAIIGGIFWFIRKSDIDKYTKKQELAMKILEKSKRIRLEVMADINELGDEWLRQTVNNTSV